MTEQEKEAEPKVEHVMTEKEFEICMQWFGGGSGEKYQTSSQIRHWRVEYAKS